jgi:hypothetical protein
MKLAAFILSNLEPIFHRTGAAATVSGIGF